MKTILMTVYMLSSGTFVGEPWQSFNSFEECQTAEYELKQNVPTDRFIFASGCLDENVIHKFAGFEFSVHDAEKK